MLSPCIYECRATACMHICVRTHMFTHIDLSYAHELHGGHHVTWPLSGLVQCVCMLNAADSACASTSSGS
jgi:hypothetical protein